MSTSEIDPQKIFAIVVGISRYHAPNGSVSLDTALSPDQDALRFCYHLTRDRHIPRENIVLFLSEAPNYEAANLPPDAADFLPQAWTRADKEFVRDWLTSDLFHLKGELLYVYWSGHGVSEIKKEQALFFADAHSDDLKNLNLDSLLTHLNSNPKVHFPRQIVFVDACSSYRHTGRDLVDNLLQDGADAGRAREVKQVVLVAAEPGDKAGIGLYPYNGSMVPKGHFTNELMQTLAQERYRTNAALWERRAEFVCEIYNTFQRWRGQNPKVQAPRYELTDGSNILRGGGFAETENRPAQPQYLLTLLELKERLIEFGRRMDVAEFRERYHRLPGQAVVYLLSCAEEDAPDDFIKHLTRRKLVEIDCRNNPLREGMEKPPPPPYYAHPFSPAAFGAIRDPVEHEYNLLKCGFPGPVKEPPASAADKTASFACVVSAKVVLTEWSGGSLCDKLDVFLKACDRFSAEHNLCLLVFIVLQQTREPSAPLPDQTCLPSQAACKTPPDYALRHWLSKRRLLALLKRRQAAFRELKPPKLFYATATMTWLGDILESYNVSRTALDSFQKQTFPPCGSQFMKTVELRIEQHHALWQKQTTS